MRFDPAQHLHPFAALAALAILLTACSGDAGTEASADNETATSTPT